MSTVSRLEPSRFGPIVVLNGASSSGKTSLAIELQKLLPVPYQHLQLDSFRAMEPAGYWKDWQTRDKHETALQLAALCRAMNAAVAEYSRHGQGVIFDTVLSDRDATDYLLQDLASFPVLMVGVFCESAELEVRERSRGDRKVGLASSQLDIVHAGKHYDFQVDTTHETPEACALKVASWLRARGESGAG